MYKILHQGNMFAESELEIGDPPMGCVAGQLIGIDDLKNFSSLLLSLGGSESDGECRLELTSEFRIVSDKDTQVSYSGGQIMVYVELDEALIDVVGIPHPEYGDLFPDHVKAYDDKF